MNQSVAASTLQLIGAGAFGFVIGWFLYYVNRYRKAEIKLTDLVSLLGAVGGGAVLALFPARSDLFGAYGIGLFCGFIGYFLILVLMVSCSKNFNVDWFLDGRRKKLADSEDLPEEIKTPPQPPMGGEHSGINR